MKIFIWSIMLIILISLFFINEIATMKKNKQHQSMLRYINLRKTFVPNVSFFKPQEYYKMGSFFRMTNTGTALDEDPELIVFREFGKRKEYYL